MREKTILLVEDNPDDRELARLALEEAGLRNKLKTVADGVEAVEYLKKIGEQKVTEDIDYPALVLLDIKMPKMDGFEVLRWIRSNLPTKDLPVVILTSSSEERDLMEGYAEGCNSYVRKPIDFDQFYEAVRQLGLYWLVLNETPLVGSRK